MNKKVAYIISEMDEVKAILKNAENTDTISSLELDTIKFKFQKMYETVNQINTKEAKEEIKQIEVKKEVVEPEKHIHKKESDLIEIEKPEKEVKKPELPKEEITEKIVAHSEHHKETIIAEKYAKDHKFINEVISQGTQKKDFSSMLQSKPISSIEGAIGINEKFLFIHDLFNGDSDTYNKTIEILNNSANFNEAFNYLHNTFSWEMKSEAAQKLLELVRRRFIV
jgi:hypothetical protein